jgi:elongation factor Ts
MPMEITAQTVKELREMTGAGMMDCKRALELAGGDSQKAVFILREQGFAKAAKKAERAASEGLIYSYIHPGDKLGVLLELNCETDFVARTDDFKLLTKDIAMQIAAANPLVVDRSQLDGALIEREKEIYKTQALNEGKPEKILDKIVGGRLEKYYQEVVLLEQPFIKDQDITVRVLLTNAISRLGENIVIKRFTRFRLGE